MAVPLQSIAGDRVADRERKKTTAECQHDKIQHFDAPYKKDSTNLHFRAGSALRLIKGSSSFPA